MCTEDGVHKEDATAYGRHANGLHGDATAHGRLRTDPGVRMVYTVTRRYSDTGRRTGQCWYEHTWRRAMGWAQ